MDLPNSPHPIDGRRVRFDQGVLAVALLAGFVFRQAWVVPLFAVFVALAAAFGPEASVAQRFFDAVVEPRIGLAGYVEDRTAVRTAAVLAAAVLTLATTAAVLGAEGLAWTLALLEAGVAALAATARVNVATWVFDRVARR